MTEKAYKKTKLEKFTLGLEYNISWAEAKQLIRSRTHNQ